MPCARKLSYFFDIIYQVVEKRHERSQDKAKFDEKAEFMSINEHFETNFNAVLASAIVFQQPDKNKKGGLNDTSGHI